MAVRVMLHVMKNDELTLVLEYGLEAFQKILPISLWNWWINGVNHRNVLIVKEWPPFPNKGKVTTRRILSYKNPPTTTDSALKVSTMLRVLGLKGAGTIEWTAGLPTITIENTMINPQKNGGGIGSAVMHLVDALEMRPNLPTILQAETKTTTKPEIPVELRNLPPIPAS